MSLGQHESESHVVPGSAARGQGSPGGTGGITGPAGPGALPEAAVPALPRGHFSFPAGYGPRSRLRPAGSHQWPRRPCDGGPADHR